MLQSNYKKKIKQEKDARYDYIIAKEQPHSHVTEPLQRIIVNLEAINQDHQVKVIQFTSSLANEGKTPFMINLAYLLSRQNKKVCVVDFDFYQPKIHYDL